MAGLYRARSGASISVEDAGTGPAVLALHGLGGGAWFFAGLGRRLSPAYRLVSVDLPGTGRSAAPSAGAVTAESWVADLGGLVEDHIGAPVVLLGHSMGTILALKAWAAWPAHVRGLVFVGGLPEARPPIRERLGERAARVAAHGMAGTGPLVSSANFARATLDGQPELVGVFERLFETQDAGAYIRCCEILRSISAVSVVPTVRVPCLAITGEEDQYAPPDLVASFAGQIPSARPPVVIPDAGHFPFLEAPGPFAAALRPFLDSLC